MDAVFQSTRPVRGGTHMGYNVFCDLVISIHPPRAGRDDPDKISSAELDEFQSTRPVRGGTLTSWNCGRLRTFQSTRPVRGGTRTAAKSRPLLLLFQSTRPVRGGTFLEQWPTAKIDISIHPPRAGRDQDWPAQGADCS